MMAFSFSACMRRSMILNLTAMGLFSLIGTHEGQANGFREFKDSRTWCSVAMTCSLTTSAQIYKGITSLSIRRHNPLSSPVELVIDVQKPLAVGDKIELFVDGYSQFHIQVQGDDPALGKTSYVVDQQGVVRSFIEAMKDGEEAQGVLHQAGGETESTFSLAGSIASMLFLDEFQNLVDTPYAFHAKGTKQPSPRLDIEAVSRLDQVPKALLNQWFVGEDKQCSFFNDKKMKRLTFGDGFKMRIGPKDMPGGGMLYSLPCGPGGAYNQPYALFFEANDAERKISSMPFTINGQIQPKQDMPEAWNVLWDLKSKTLESFFKGRGLGDCGSYSRWVLIKHGSSYAFDLRERRVKDDCDGNYAGGPEKWPRVH